MSDKLYLLYLAVAPLAMVINWTIQSWLERRNKRRVDAVMSEVYRDWPKNAHLQSLSLDEAELEIERMYR